MTVDQRHQQTGPRTSVRPDAPTPYARTSLMLVVVVAFVWAVLESDIELSAFVDGLVRFPRIMGQMFLPPDWTYVGRAMEGMIESVQIAWLGTIIGAIASLPLALLAAKNVTGQATSNAARQILNGFRAFPELILAILFVTVVGLGPVAGMLAIGIHSIGTLGKLASEVVEGIDPGPIEASEAVGGNWFQRMRWGVLPQAMPEIVAFWLYRFEINIRASAILGVIGAGGVGAILSNTVVYRRWDKAGMTLIVVVGVTLLIDAVSGRIRRRIIEGPARGDATTEDEFVTASAEMA
ncbi:MAG: phosphonate ABC transporter, permease protein PhnE [Nitriliruptorales bacterium]|nr:phosphonate ABC transporter, permease protein PhnE [Nitriliruptorales bacterium]